MSSFPVKNIENLSWIFDDLRLFLLWNVHTYLPIFILNNNFALENFVHYPFFSLYLHWKLLFKFFSYDVDMMKNYCDEVCYFPIHESFQPQCLLLYTVDSWHKIATATNFVHKIYVGKCLDLTDIPCGDDKLICI